MAIPIPYGPSPSGLSTKELDDLDVLYVPHIELDCIG